MKQGYPYSYHDSVKGAAIESHEETALNQDQTVLAFFQKNPDKAYTPFEVFNQCKWERKPPITSVRRSITNLEKGGDLKKLKQTKAGEYGRLNHTWILVPKFIQLKLF